MDGYQRQDSRGSWPEHKLLSPLFLCTYDDQHYRILALAAAFREINSSENESKAFSSQSTPTPQKAEMPFFLFTKKPDPRRLGPLSATARSKPNRQWQWPIRDPRETLPPLLISAQSPLILFHYSLYNQQDRDSSLDHVQFTATQKTHALFLRS